LPEITFDTARAVLPQSWWLHTKPGFVLHSEFGKAVSPLIPDVCSPSGHAVLYLVFRPKKLETVTVMYILPGMAVKCLSHALVPAPQDVGAAGVAKTGRADADLGASLGLLHRQYSVLTIACFAYFDG